MYITRGRLVIALLVLSPVLAACPNGAGTPVSGPATNKCNAGLAPTDVTQPADNCHVEALTLTRPLPKANLNSIEIDLYIEGDVTCGTSFISLGCGVDDNRPYAAALSPDPRAD